VVPGRPFEIGAPPISRLDPQLLHISNTVFQKCGPLSGFWPSFWFLAPPAAKSWRRACRDVVETETPRARLHQKIRDSRRAFGDRYRDLKICEICQCFSKKCHHHFEIDFFRISCIFPTCFGRFSPADTADKRHVELQKFCYAISFQY